MRLLKSSLAFFAVMLLVLACGKSEPNAPKLKNQAEAMDFFKSFAVHWAPGTYATGGKAQYAQSSLLDINGHNAQAKVDLFLFDDDNTYVLEYWEKANGRVQGAIVQGRWAVNDSLQLVLFVNDSSQKVATGEAITLEGNKGGILLKQDKSFSFKRQGNSNLIADQVTDGWKLFYTPSPTRRWLPGNLKQELPKQMSDINSRGNVTDFPD